MDSGSKSSNRVAMYFFVTSLIEALNITGLAFQLIVAAVTPFIHIICLFAYARLREKQADLMACNYTSDKEKLAYINLFNLDLIALKDRLAYRNAPGLFYLEGLWRKIKIDSLGNSRRDFIHPPLTERIRYVQDAMVKKPVNYDPEKFLNQRIRNIKGPNFFSWLKGKVYMTQKEIIEIFHGTY